MMQTIHLAPTALVALKSFPGVWLKCEHLNPSGSHKDRAYFAMLRALGPHHAGRTFVDYTTGNGGIALARFARLLGARAVIFMPENLSAARSALILAEGGELHLTPASEFVAGSRRAAEGYVATHPEAVLLNQSDNPQNMLAFCKAGRELAVELKAAGVKPAAFVCAVGTGGAISGYASALKEEFPNIRIVAIEVPEAALMWGKRRGIEVRPELPSIIGMGPGKIAKNTNEALIDDVEIVGAQQVEMVQKALAMQDGQFVGPSTAANILVAHQYAKTLRDNVVTISFDRADRYECKPEPGLGSCG